ncbi:hypothetical protein A4S06_10720 [Erysipelotrichaceae bacterium MTC7]|nr:hypothetical protein A4S06_10720 [Erysipelotrichaceae bacterium MTC7]
MKQSIKELEATIQNHHPNLRGIKVVKKGQPIYEQYLHGGKKDDYYHVYSLTKSIVSVLIGVAIAQGKLENEQVKLIDVIDDVPRNRRLSAFDQLRVVDILKMEAPYVYEDNEQLYQDYFSSPSWIRFTLGLFGSPNEIGTFRYTPIVGPDVLTYMLTKVTGQSVLDYAKTYLFTPLDIEVKKPIHFASVKEQFQFYQSTDISGWVHDDEGLYAAGWGLTLRLDDLAKLGQLCLQHGTWQDKQIVSETWLQISTTRQSYSPQLQLAYGYLWWILDEQSHTYAAIGDGGNLIYVNEAQELVVVTTGVFSENAGDIMDLLKTTIEPTFFE